MVVLATLTRDGKVGGGFGRAENVLVGTLENGSLRNFKKIAVGWGAKHDLRPGGLHHAEIARFLMDHRVAFVLTGHMGPGMERMLGAMGIRSRVGPEGDLEDLLNEIAET